MPDRLGVVKPKEGEEGRDYKGALDNFCDDGYTYYLNSEDGFLGGNLSKYTLKYFQFIMSIIPQSSCFKRKAKTPRFLTQGNY